MSRWTGGRVGITSECVVAPNPGPTTLEGTNTWVLRADAAAPSVVVDPGPLDPGHLEAVARTAGEVAVVLLTHRHLDHSEGARAFADRVGCGVRAIDPAYRHGGEGLHDGDVVTAGELEVHVVATPGHTSDSLSFYLPSQEALLTGDTLLGRGSTVVAHPDGRLRHYLASLQRLRSLAESHGVKALWPGHGPVLEDPVAAIEGYLAHRRERLAQVRQALRELGPTASPGAVVERVYGDVAPALRGAAELSVRAQLDHLRGTDAAPGGGVSVPGAPAGRCP